MGEMPTNIENWDLRADQRYLYRMVVAINNGTCDESLGQDKPGCVSMARWLTTASRILRLYVTKINPDTKLQQVVKCIIIFFAKK